MRHFAIVITLTMILAINAFGQDSLFMSPVNLGVGNYPDAVAAADLDGDNDIDLAVANDQGGNVSVLINNGDASFQSAVDYATGNSPATVFAADLNADGYNDLAAANELSENVSVLLNNGNGTFQPSINYAVGFGPGSNPITVFAARLNTDSSYDLAVVYYSGGVSILLNNGNGTFQAPINYSLGSSPYSVFASDLDHDGDNDLAITSYGSSNIFILKNNGDGTFQAPDNYDGSSASTSVFAADLFGNGNLDLAVSRRDGRFAILRNIGDGTFQNPVYYDAGGDTYTIYAADFDNDGDYDLVMGNYDPLSVSISLNNGDGSFQPPITFGPQNHHHTAVASDLDGDGYMDLAVTNGSTNDLSVFINRYRFAPPLCYYLPGDANGSNSFNGLDVTYSLNYLKGFGSPPPDSCDCPPHGMLYVAADANGSCSFNGSDIVYSINYLKGFGQAARPCLDCAPISDSGLVAYLPFNGNGHDQSGHGNNGTPYGVDLMPDRFDAPNSAYYFDAPEDSIILGNDLSLNPTSELTISAWANFDSDAIYQQTIVSKHGPYDVGLDSYLLSWNGFQDSRISFYISDDGNHFYARFSSIALQSQSGWHHIVGIFKGSQNLDIYIDGIISNNDTVYYNSGEGQSYPTLTLPSQIALTATPVIIGHWRSGNGTNHFFGTLDDIRIYNRALSPAEIQALYHQRGWSR